MIAARALVTAALAVAAALPLSTAASDRRVESDPRFDFGAVRSWAWDPKGAGDVKMARAPDDDPEVVRRRIEPVVMAAVERELTKRGLAAAAGAAPDLAMHYYVLITIGTSGQEMGQFLPSITQWGVPPFAPQATSYEIVQTGSLILDALSPARDVVWRGIAQENIDKIKDTNDRDERIRKAVRGLIDKLPVKRR